MGLIDNYNNLNGAPMEEVLATIEGIEQSNVASSVAIEAYVLAPPQCAEDGECSETGDWVAARYEEGKVSRPEEEPIFTSKPDGAIITTIASDTYDDDKDFWVPIDDHSCMILENGEISYVIIPVENPFDELTEV